MEIFELEAEIEQLQKMKEQSDRGLDLYIEAVRVRERKIRQLEHIITHASPPIKNILEIITSEEYTSI